MKEYVFIISMLIVGSLNAQQIITDRPDQTESSSTISQGSLQIESGILVGFTEENSKSERQILAPTTLFRYGITKGIEIRILNQFEKVKNQLDAKEINGISDLEIGTKIQILQREGINTEIAFLSHLVLPTGSKGLSSEDGGMINKLLISHQLNENIGIGYNVGLDIFGENAYFTYSVALGIGITEKVAIYIEPYGHSIDGEDIASNFDAGFTYLVQDNLQLDFSFGTGINHTMNYISTGVSWNINKGVESL